MYKRIFILVMVAQFFQAWADDKSPSSASSASDQTHASQSINLDKSLKKNNWYASWGYSRQQYAPSDIHVTQTGPDVNSNFTLKNVRASDDPSGVTDAIKDIFSLDFTNPQDNGRIGKFLNDEKTFAVEFSLDHAKYNNVPNQTVTASGYSSAANPNTLTSLQLTPQNFYYALHNGLNYLMINGVWFQHLAGPTNQAGDLQLVSRTGAGILLPHADNIIFGIPDAVGPKDQNICCFASKDWWQVNGWTMGAEVGFRYAVYKSMYLEFTTKVAYGVLKSVPVYEGTADQKIWMGEEVLSAGFLF